MKNPMLALAALVPLFGGSVAADSRTARKAETPNRSVEDGKAWLAKVEERLYAWPKPGCTVRFQVRTDILDTAIAMLRKDLEARPDDTATRAVEALRRVSIKGLVDTSTGEAKVDVDIPFETDDPARKAGMEKAKQGITTMVSKAFQGLPLSDANMLGKGMSVIDSKEEGDSIIVRVAGKRDGEETTIRIDRQRLLPETFENAAYKMEMRFTEVVPGKFAPSRLDIEAIKQPKTSADYTYQRVGELVFPATVKVVSGEQKATLRFESVSVLRSKP